MAPTEELQAILDVSEEDLAAIPEGDRLAWQQTVEIIKQEVAEATATQKQLLQKMALAKDRAFANVPEALQQRGKLRRTAEGAVVVQGTQSFEHPHAADELAKKVKELGMDPADYKREAPEKKAKGKGRGRGLCARQRLAARRGAPAAADDSVIAAAGPAPPLPAPPGTPE